MNKRIVSITIAVCLVIIIACTISAIFYNSNTTVPAIASQVSEKNQQIATQTASILATTVAFEQTQTAIPTPTSSPSPTVPPTTVPEQSLCEATILGNAGTVYPVPGQGSSYFSQTLDPGTKVMILGRLADRGWEKIKTEEVQGWIRENALRNADNCQPTVYDLHYLQSWLNPGEKLILEDTFSFGAPWVDSDETTLFIKTAPDGEAYLEVLVDKAKLVFPKATQMEDLSAFKVYTSITLNGASQNSFIGFRFRENNDHYFQAELFPSDCRLDVYDVDSLVYSNYLVRKICVDRYYDISMGISQGNRFEIQINGFDPISIDLQDPDGQLSQGAIKLVMQNVGMQLHYFIVTAPDNQ